MAVFILHPSSFILPLCLCGGILPFAAVAQVPRINTLFPIGGKAGTTVEVELRGANLAGADRILVAGEGVSGTLEPGADKPDETNRPLWQNKCGLCHELRSPANRSMTPAQWEATVERMVKRNNAPLSADEQKKVTDYLVSAAKAGRVTAKMDISPNAKPGVYQIRAVTPKGVSTVGLFEVGALPEVLAVNGTRESAQPITLPCIANGCFAGNGERHFFKFTAKKGQRYIFDLKGFRYNDATQMFYNPQLLLYDAAGAQVAENHGYYDLDPVLDWTSPADGDFTLEARDLLGRGNPSSVYRLTMRPVDSGFKLPPPESYLPTPPKPSPLECVVRPDNVTVRPGIEVPLQVILTRRDGVKGDVAISADGLPPGVVAIPSSIPPDRNEGYVIVSAAPDAHDWSGPIRVVASAKAGSADEKAVAVPQEEYRINNGIYYAARAETALAVCGTAGFTVSLASTDPVKVHPRKETPVKVLVKRNKGFGGAVAVRLVNLPQGWICYPETAQPNQNEITILVRPDGANPNPFLKRDAGLTPIRAVVEAWTDEFIYSFGTVPIAKADKITDDDKP